MNQSPPGALVNLCFGIAICFWAYDRIYRWKGGPGPSTKDKKSLMYIWLVTGSLILAFYLATGSAEGAGTLTGSALSLISIFWQINRYRSRKYWRLNPLASFQPISSIDSETPPLREQPSSDWKSRLRRAWMLLCFLWAALMVAFASSERDQSVYFYAAIAPVIGMWLLRIAFTFIMHGRFSFPALF